MPTIISCLAISLTALVGLSLLVSIALTGVPTLSSSRSEVDDVVALLKLARLSEHAVIMDLGSGWGSLVVALAHAFPTASVLGVEISPFPYLVSRLRIRRFPNATVRWENFFRSDLGSADAIVCYLMPKLMAPLKERLDATAKPGTCVVTNTFLFRGRTISAIRERRLRGAVALYIWPARHLVG
jgi:hypothetical protein